jgi:5'-nucleotidase / UDP-sugar diphosphatase
MRTFAPVLLLVGVVACGSSDKTPTEQRLVIFHTNDEHSHLFGFGPEIDDFPLPTTAGEGAIVGSVTRRATVLEQERAAAAEAGIDTLTVSAGDETQGALPQIAFSTTAPDFVVLGALGYDVMCPGNHEFDLGPAALAASIEAAMARGGMPQFVSTNIHFDPDDPGDDSLEALFGEGDSDKPIKRYHVITTPSGIKVGFIGIMGVSAALYAPFKTPVRFSGDPAHEGNEERILPALYDDLRPTVAHLREHEQVDLVIALSHSGVDTDNPERGDDYQIAKNVAGIDVIVSGHSHTPLFEPMMVENPDGQMVAIVQAGYYGRWLGRLELVLEPGQPPRVDMEGTRLIEIDDRIIPSPGAIADLLEAIIEQLESRDDPGTPSVLEAALTRVLGEPVTDDPTVLGDLYYYPLGETTFDMRGLRGAGESNVLNLSADAMVWAAGELGLTPLIGVQAGGVVRADIQKGVSGILTFADLFRVLPLGDDPTDSTVGYPLVYYYAFTAELKAAMEVAVSRGLIGGGTFFLVASNMRVEYDLSRDPQVLGSLTDALDPQNGRVTKMVLLDVLDENEEPIALFDLDRGSPWNSPLGGALSLHPVITNLYIASFSGEAGATMKDASGNDITLEEAIVRRTDGSSVKDWEALMGYVRHASEQNAGLLPDLYDDDSPDHGLPRRMICVGAACP